MRGLILTFILFLTGCSSEPTKLDSKYAQFMVPNIDFKIQYPELERQYIRVLESFNHARFNDAELCLPGRVRNLYNSLDVIKRELQAGMLQDASYHLFLTEMEVGKLECSLVALKNKAHCNDKSGRFIKVNKWREIENFDSCDDEKITATNNTYQSGPIHEVIFDTGSTVIKPYYKAYLEFVSEILTNNKNLGLEIIGHTDDRGDSKYNLTLSSDRAKAVEEYIIELGVKSHRLKKIFYGKSKPRETNFSYSGRQLNRRVEIKFLNKLDTLKTARENNIGEENVSSY